MARKSKTRCIGILTSGGDCPGLNAAIRSIAKSAINVHGMSVIGIQDGFRGLVEKRTIPLDNKKVSGILTIGGTILGTSRDKLHKMPMGDKTLDMIDVAVENLQKLHIDCLVCLGGGGTQKNALRLQQTGKVNVITLPKTIDNDVWGTDITFGYDTACQTATEAIDRLHTTASSHHRVIICEIMGHRAGWLALESGIAGGADVILIPEIPYDLNIVADYLLQRRKKGSRFSIIALAEGAIAQKNDDKKKSKKKSKKESYDRRAFEHLEPASIATRVGRELQELTNLDVRVTSLGHLQRGGIPTAFDRWLCTRLGVAAVECIVQGTFDVMIAYRNGKCTPVPLEEIAGKRKTVPMDHHSITAARLVGTCMGDHP